MSKRRCWHCDAQAADADRDAAIAWQLSLEPRNLVTPAQRERRLKYCQSCPANNNETCTECGCYIRFRTNLKNKKCPINKWTKIES
ncbi:DUF6171 family protein [Lacticaseibacillus baoqingensis]|uniref:DUF6171 family protein n=1 Tax=Lacticaseibacillus baoqingensis TaxID=2486013 RepID=A0ABW4E8U5_9LACO|nr:DUF6171 family protein [Lacticaseibacillus baoqingensis]